LHLLPTLYFSCICTGKPLDENARKKIKEAMGNALRALVRGAGEPESEDKSG